MGVSSIIKLVLALMIASLFISVATLGALGNAMQESFENIGTSADLTSEIENERQLSDLAMFVRDRAVDCEQVIERNDGEPLDGWPNDGEQGYPGLEDTGLGQNPSCFGGDTSVIRDPLQAIPGRGMLGGGPDDNNMRGIYSREQFEIKEEIKIDEDRDHYWLDTNVAGVSSKMYEEHISEEGLEDSGGSPNELYHGTGRNFVYFFEEGVGDSRSNLLIEEDLDDFEERIWYCGIEQVAGGSPQTQCEKENLEEAVEDKYFEVQLCPGDKGYIQLNAETPQNEGAGDADGSEDYYPRIVIEQTEMESCGDGEELGSPDPYVGPYTGSQIFVRAGVGDGATDWPETENFDLMETGERRGSDWVRDHADEDNLGGPDSCEMYFHEERGFGQRDAASLRTYTTGTHIRQNDGNFPSAYIDESPRVDEGGGPGNPDTPIYADDLIDEIGALDGSTIGPEAGELRPSNPNDGWNELYSDLLCHNPDDLEFAEWHLCDEGLDEDLKEIETDSGTWSCDADDGEWSFDTQGGGGL